MDLQIERAEILSAESRQLMAELWAEIDLLYGNEIATAAEFHGTGADEIVFVVARLKGNAVGCGAIRPRHASIAEVKRVFVRPAARRSGVARAIMHALEQLARERDFSALWLETGLRQPGALALYESLGYTRIAAFGDYKDDPLSVCLGKRLK
ncbi:MAG: GNAT family N-acetyltransferase [Chthoniobacterales bacterium]